MVITNALYTVRDAAKELTVSVRTIYRMAAQGRISIIKVSARRVVISGTELLRILEKEKDDEKGKT